ncbi:beta-amyrin 11-oxidase [Ziziphus jujuba]|uniref:Beta-amyrin 11-oxidase n=1 Tax=Ziziphus jujuba TaxID=326968 RepID=A0ABM3I2S2_ZIZJJ|nr:beta-amyrin 11-oxidase [Ziziphus jujuba]
MEKELVWTIVGVLVGGYVFLFGFVGKLNDWYYSFKLKRKEVPLPPGDLGWPGIGKMLNFIKASKFGDPDSFIFDLFKKYGRTGIYKTHLLSSPTVIVCSPDTCRKILADDENFTLGYPQTSKILAGKRSFHSISKSEHKRLRRLTTSILNGHEALSMYVGHIEHNVINSLEEWSRLNRPIEVLPELKRIVFKVITHIFMGADDDPVVADMESLFTELHAGLFSLNVNLPGFAFHRAIKARKKLVKILSYVIEKKTKALNKEPEKGKRDMIDLLMAVEDDDGRKLEEEDIIDLLIMFLVAGHESSALGTMWGLINLAENPEVFKKAKEEQEMIVRNRPSTQKGLTLREIKSMTYLPRVIDEMMRKTSINFAAFRHAIEDVNINGYLIPKGWKILVWYRAIHMDPQIHPNPREFNLERWDNDGVKTGAFVPFGAGTRICPGRDLAKLEMSIFLHYFLLNYKLEKVNPKCPVTYIPVPRPTDNCLAKIVKVA